MIASQALITGAFSVTKQAIQLGYLPRLRIAHTSVRETGQIYLPFVNWGLFVGIVLAVVLFGSSSKLAAAYGIAVTIDMLITTTMTFFVDPLRLEVPAGRCASLATGFFFVVDFAFFAANIVKVFDGGWFPLLIGGADVHADDDLEAGPQADGRAAARRRDRPDELPRVGVHQPADARVDGTAVFLVAEPGPDAERAAAQPQAQQGAARAQPVRHGAPPRGAVDRRSTSAARSSRWATTAGR